MSRLVLALVLGLGLGAITAVRADAPKPGSGNQVGHHVIELAGSTNAAKPPAQEIKVLLETPHLKLVTITLRDGKVLDPHSAPTPVTIQALRGRGTVEIGGAREAVSADRMVVLAPGTKHAVIPDGKAELVLLVHHIKPAPRQGAGGR
jgi:quercetin dioxygenase-like cupin family protein